MGEGPMAVKRSKIFSLYPLLILFVHVHNARPAEVQALIEAGACWEAVSKAVDEFETRCKIRGPADGNDRKRSAPGSGEAKKDCDDGVDGIEIGCIVVGSLGHFGATG